MPIFTGAGTAMATPMNADGSINFDALEKMTDDQIAGSIDALIVCGTSGEAPTLEDDEHIEAIAVQLMYTRSGMTSHSLTVPR
ncbi:MAG: dihydrodipicolinate synthase family protein [Lachnospiraceae bacterium]|nr:dihydrodipicolinate synthase family protein [Lachnospiraceae bacterium]